MRQNPAACPFPPKRACLPETIRHRLSDRTGEQRDNFFFISYLPKKLSRGDTPRQSVQSVKASNVLLSASHWPHVGGASLVAVDHLAGEAEGSLSLK
ncbi:hypothetical protein THIOM_000334 [Candidatus Thiomargarita nelsonii]|uniref:Uncharacterized protein n=1 Tax=Candidatus Thiomargarita nelsonii TaxID=1003181 RepID=A0A176S6W3_9GAMM|nr:hypothetical protein THIOM_000334 [Candidatus Thiomargarita nelsonii]